MKRKALHKIEVYAGTRPAGSAEFYAIPVENLTDFSCDAKDLMSLDDAKRIAIDIGSGKVIGTVGEYEWRR